MADLNKPRTKKISLGELVRRAKIGDLSPQDLESIEQVKETVLSINASFDEQFKAYCNGVASSLSPIFDDINRAKEIAKFYSGDQYPEAIMDSIESNLDAHGELTVRQIFFLISEIRGVDTVNIAASLGRRGGVSKKGHKSDIRKALEQVVNQVGDSSYQAVRRYLAKADNFSCLDSVLVLSCDLPIKTNGNGKLIYNDSNGRQLEIGCSGVEGHLKKIRKS